MADPDDGIPDDGIPDDDDEEHADGTDAAFMTSSLRLVLDLAEVRAAVQELYASLDGVVHAVHLDVERGRVVVDVDVQLESGMAAMSSGDLLGTVVVELPLEVADAGGGLAPHDAG